MITARFTVDLEIVCTVCDDHLKAIHSAEERKVELVNWLAHVLQAHRPDDIGAMVGLFD